MFLFTPKYLLKARLFSRSSKLRPIPPSIGFVIVSMLLALPGYAHDDEPSLIRVSAEGSAKAQPDQASFSVRFTDTQMDSDEARNNVDKQVKKLLNALEDFNLKKQSLDSSQVQIHPQYRYRQNERQFNGYQVERQVIFILQDLNQLGALVKAVTATKTAQLGPVQFGLAKPQAVQQKALNKAIAKSKQLAGKIAKAYDVKLGKIHSVDYQSSRSNHPAPMRAMSMQMEMASAKEDNSYQQQDLEFKARVNTAFTFE